MLLFYWNVQIWEGSHRSIHHVSGWKKWGHWPFQNLLYHRVLNCKKSIFQVKTSKACMSSTFWNEHTGEFDTTWFHSTGKVSVFVLLFCMKVASKLSKIFLFRNYFCLLVFKTPFEFSKYTFWFHTPLLLISKLFCFSGISVSYHLECSEENPKYFQLSSYQDFNSTLRKEGEEEKKKSTKNQPLKCPVKAMKSHARKKKIKKPSLGLSKGNILLI